MLDLNQIAKKWQKKWEESKIFEANPDKRKKFFCNFPYPYMNSVPHIGHFFTLMRVEAFARYKRMKGFNVLFPQAWHCTGSPIVAAAKRIEEGEEKQIKSLKDQEFTDQEVEKLKNPEEWTKVFPRIWEQEYKNLGISYDRRRSFITTSLNPYYDRFIKWQFNKLKEKGYIIKGRHPVVWDPKTNMPVGDHDRIEGEGEVPQEFLLFKHELSPKRFILSATIRQDTCLGITNLYIHPDFEYTEIENKGEKWIVNEKCAEKLQQQGFKIKKIGKILGKNLIGKKVKVIGDREVLILPATFLDPNVGTGLVHSVPSDSADDFIALKDLKKDKETIKKYNLKADEVNAIEPIPVLNTPELGDMPAEEIIKKYKIESQMDKQKLQKAKEELYKLSFYSATFNERYKTFFSKDISGLKVQEAKDFIKEELLKKGKVEVFYELTGRVISRSLTECMVKIVDDQWFIKYSDKNWKEKTHKALRRLRIYPEEVRKQFEYVLNWINDWACTREYGLGTRLPFDDKWLIESLSDSTIYKTYYTIAHLINEIPIRKINDAFFDYVFLGKGEKPNIKNVEKLKQEFNYWYPVDFRNSGKDLVQNHLAFYLFNHTAIFPQKHWPLGIGVNGWVRVEGKKMSKSLGNMIPLKEIAEKFGPDASRITILNGGEGLDDPNWDSNFAIMINKKLSQFYDFAIQNYGNGRENRKEIDNWMDKELNKIITEAEASMEETLFRSAIQKIFFDLQSSLRWYLRREENPNKDTIKRVIELQTLSLSPFTPHFCEEIWEKIGKKDYISKEKWPTLKEVKYKGDEELIKRTLEDINSLLNIVKIKPAKVYLYTLSEEKSVVEEASGFFKKELNKEVLVFSKDDKGIHDPKNKSDKAMKGKVAIYLE